MESCYYENIVKYFLGKSAYAVATEDYHFEHVPQYVLEVWCGIIASSEIKDSAERELAFKRILEDAARNVWRH
ncbi:hypothetical protein [Sporolactobacillus putidus]|uniref:Uncharacterized protein n=1 Tax=Sporolactobacillus putidus TaxID=492735 RepID=A0A917S9H2_9BACL|nr:hypothetical protein [Sporolactobacillus putidus]GGL63022.1 hypothetical protein GCM10007968_28700 [Sporolactobacillus putidus]